MTETASRLSKAAVWLASLGYAYWTYAVASRPAKTVIRWFAALTGASIVYVLVMLLLASLWQAGPAHAALCCALSMTVAVCCGTWAARAILLPGQRPRAVWACTALGMVYPALLAANAAPATGVDLAWYGMGVAASLAGGVLAACGTHAGPGGIASA
jgi:hypothetical protein